MSLANQNKYCDIEYPISNNNPNNNLDNHYSTFKRPKEYLCAVLCFGVVVRYRDREENFNAVNQLVIKMLYIRVVP